MVPFKFTMSTNSLEYVVGKIQQVMGPMSLQSFSTHEYLKSACNFVLWHTRFLETIEADGGYVYRYFLNENYVPNFAPLSPDPQRVAEDEAEIRRNLVIRFTFFIKQTLSADVKQFADGTGLKGKPLYDVIVRAYETMSPDEMLRMAKAVPFFHLFMGRPREAKDFVISNLRLQNALTLSVDMAGLHYLLTLESPEAEALVLRQFPVLFDFYQVLRLVEPFLPPEDIPFVALSTEGYRVSDSSRPRKNAGKQSLMRCRRCQVVGHKSEVCRAKEPIPSSPFYPVVLEYVFLVPRGEQPDLANFWADSGATTHICNNRSFFTSFEAADGSVAGLAGTLPLKGKGTIFLGPTLLGQHIVLQDVLYVPTSRFNLVSVSKLARGEHPLMVGGLDVYNGGDHVGHLDESFELYKLTLPVDTKPQMPLILKASPGPDYHARFGHPGDTRMQILQSQGIFKLKDWSLSATCATCQLAKLRMFPPSTADTAPTAPLELLHTDVCGPFPDQGLDGDKYFLTITDGYTHFVTVYPLRLKSEVPDKLISFIRQANTRFSSKGFKVGAVRSDNGGEFVNQKLQLFYEEQGIRQELTVPEHLYQNGVAERLNQTLLTMARSLLIGAGLPKLFWGEAVMCAAFLTNAIPRSRNSKSSYEQWTGYKPRFDRFRPFGCAAFALLPMDKRASKFDARSVPGIMVGYSSKHKAYRIYVPRLRSIIVSAHVTFNEYVFPPLVEDPLDKTPIKGSMFSGLVASGATQLPLSQSPPLGAVEQPVSDVTEDVDVSSDSLPLESSLPPYVPSPSPEGSRQNSPLRPSRLVRPSELVIDMQAPDGSDWLTPLPVSPTAISPPGGESSDPPPSTEMTARESLAPQLRPRSSEPEDLNSHKRAKLLDAVEVFLRTPLSLETLKRARSVSPLGITGTLDDRPDAAVTDNAPETPSGLTKRPRIETFDYLGNSAARKVQGMLANAAKTLGHVLSVVSGLYTSPSQDPMYIPRHVKDAQLCAMADLWQAAIDLEMAAHATNKTWSVCALPKNRRAVGSRWVFTIKDTLPPKYKARLVAQGFSQREGIDYNETFSPVVRYDSVRVLLALAVHFDMVIHQMDVTTAFLNGKLKETIYMRPPPGIDLPDGSVCRLHKSLYGLKQSPLCWNQEIDRVLKEAGFARNTAEFGVYAKHTSGNIADSIFIGLYVDDLLILSRSPAAISDLKRLLLEKFEMKDLGLAESFLGMQILASPGRVLLSMPRYISSLLKVEGLSDCHAAAIPMLKNLDLDNTTTPLCDETAYRSLVGKLLFAAGTVRPDISFAVGVLSRYLQHPREAHAAAAKHVCRYLKGTLDTGLVYSKLTPFTLTGYSDASWGGESNDCRSTGGYYFFLSNAPVTWRSKKQPTVALSSMESEYMALTESVKELVWLQLLFDGLGVTFDAKPTIYEDNMSSIHLSLHPLVHPRSKHINMRHHYIREVLADGVFNLEYVPTRDMLADMLTKPLGRIIFTLLRDQSKIIATGPSPGIKPLATVALAMC